MLIPLNINAYTLNSPQFSCQTCVNFFPSIDQQQYGDAATEALLPSKGGKRSSLLYPTDGLELVASNNLDHETRAQLVVDDEHYIIIGPTLYQFFHETGSLESRGTLLTSTGMCSIISNKTQLMISDDTYGYYMTRAGGSVTTISDVDFKTPGKLTYQDGYGIYIHEGTSNFYISTLNDFSSWQLADQGATSSFPNILVSLVNANLELYLFGSVRGEVWSHTGASPFPWERNNNTSIQFGLASEYGICTADNTVYFLGRDENGMICAACLRGYTAQMVSTEAINTEFSKMDKVDDCEVFAYARNGHYFVVYNFPAADRTLVYDILSNKWHERKSQKGANPSQQGRWLGRNYAYHNNTHYIGDYKSGNLYKLSTDHFKDNEFPILREFTTPVMTNDDETYIECSSLQLGAEVGVGATTGQGENPQIMLEISKDSGRTFEPMRMKTLGKLGKYRTRIKFNALGHARNWCFRVTTSDPVYISFFDIKAEIQQGDN